VRVGVRLRPGEAGFAEFDAVKLPQEAGAPAPEDRLAAALGLAPNEIGFENHRPTRYTAGLPFTFVPIRDLQAIGGCAVVAQHWRQAFGADGVGMAFAYCRECVHTHASFHARMFAPMVLSSPEDPATGSAAVALAGAIQRFDEPPDGSHSCLIEQGYEMGRPSTIHLEFEIAGGNLRAVRIGGHAVPISTGELSV
jgi:trans-2,3-dihydro-3-hydroxyanthranilate isomerase